VNGLMFQSNYRKTDLVKEDDRFRLFIFQYQESSFGTLVWIPGNFHCTSFFCLFFFFFFFWGGGGLFSLVSAVSHQRESG
jgi:hypothetical protein